MHTRLHTYFICIAVALAMIPSVTKAQSKGDEFIYLDWETSVPDLNGYITNVSFGGGHAGYQRMISNRFSLGVSVGYIVFGQFFSQHTFPDETGSAAITADMDRDLYLIPITMQGNFYFNKNKSMSPYIGIGAGTQYCSEVTFYSSYTADNHNWGLLLKPEIGALLSPNPALSVHIAVGYSYSTNKTEFFQKENIAQLFFRLGIAFQKYSGR